MTREEVRARFVERMGAALTAAGLSRLPARVFAAVLVDDDGRMTAADLTGVLGVSASSVSGAVNYLEGVRMLRRERERGSRRDVFVVDDHAWHDVLLNASQLYAPLVNALASGVHDLPADDPAHHRLDVSRAFLEFVTEEMAGLSARWRARQAELGL